MAILDCFRKVRRPEERRLILECASNVSVYTTSPPKGTLAGVQNNRFDASRKPNPGIESAQKGPAPPGPPQQLAQSPEPMQGPRTTGQVASSTAPSQDGASPRTIYGGRYDPAAHTAPTSSASSPMVPSQPHPSLRTQNPATNSTVMNETLSVIDEHITDMKHPVLGAGSRNLRPTNDSASEYSAMVSETRRSYIQGSETEEEESIAHTEKEVKDWSPARVAEYLEEVGVEKRHCDVFKEQEFSGDVILGMEQSSIFLKELELGPIGRRLKTWQKIRALQDEVSPPKPSQTRKVSEHSQSSSRRASQGSLGMLQRSSQLLERSGSDSVDGLANQLQAQVQPGRAEGGSTLNMVSASARPGLPNSQSSRPSAASVRSLGHSRRHSSIDQALSHTPASPSQQVQAPSHTKQPSLDQNWNMANALGPANNNARPISSAHAPSASADRTAFEKRTSQFNLNTTVDQDRGYVSSTEGDGRKERRVLKKREGTDHNRASSYETGKRLSFFRRSSRASSPARSREISAPSSVIHTGTGNGSGDTLPAASTAPSEQSMPPTVTNLEQDNRIVKEQATIPPDSASSDPQPSPRKDVRAISDAVTGREKALHSMWAENVSPTETSIPHSPSSGTPSGASRSIELDDANKSQYATPLGMPPTSGTKRKSKKKTSAYLRGLEQKSPQEQIIGCEYSGWMKKKSSNLMTNWKPRLFVLRGRRLSYYYSEHDMEEKGLIDISGHRVLPADNERLTGLHATITKATSSPTSPQILKSSTFSSTPTASPTTSAPDGGAETNVSTPSTMNGSSMPNTPKEGVSGQGFIFKLVPPRVGLSKAVNFTEPTVHYFAVPSVEVGRLWMAALMKATIDRDESVEVVTTYQQKTISLAKARARKERPPALKGLEEEEDMETLAGTTEADSQLEKVDEASDVEEEEAETRPVTKPEEEEPMDQMREVTDLSPVMSRTSMSPGGHSKQNSRSKRSGSGEGLGIQGLSNGGSGSPLLNQMKTAGLW